MAAAAAPAPSHGGGVRTGTDSNTNSDSSSSNRSGEPETDIGGNMATTTMPAMSNPRDPQRAAVGGGLYSPFDPMGSAGAGFGRTFSHNAAYTGNLDTGGNSRPSRLLGGLPTTSPPSTTSTGTSTPMPNTSGNTNMGSGFDVHVDAALLDASYAYCFDRGNGKFARLVPADALPASPHLCGDVPSLQHGCAGMLVLPVPRGLPPDGGSSVVIGGGVGVGGRESVNVGVGNSGFEAVGGFRVSCFRESCFCADKNGGNDHFAREKKKKSS